MTAPSPILSSAKLLNSWSPSRLILFASVLFRRSAALHLSNMLVAKLVEIREFSIAVFCITIWKKVNCKNSANRRGQEDLNSKEKACSGLHRLATVSHVNRSSRAVLFRSFTHSLIFELILIRFSTLGTKYKTMIN